MKIRTISLILVSIIPTAAGAWLPIGNFYHGPTIEIQLGDICDAARFAATPGTCTGGDPDWRLEIQEALARWNTAQTNFVFTDDPGIGASMPGSCDSADPNSVFFLSHVCGPAFGGSTLAVARTVSDLSRQSAHSDVIFNTAFTWGAYDDERANHPGVTDFRRVAVHEFGHVLGLNHPFNTDAIMYFAIQDLTAPQPDDIAGASAIYGASIVRRAGDLNGAMAELNGGGVSEIVHIRRSAFGDVRASIWDPETGAQLAALDYFVGGFADPGDTVMPVDAVMIPDQDGDGQPELAVLGIRIGNLRPLVEIQNISGDPAPRRVAFSHGYKAMRLRNIGDADGNGVTELAVMGIRDVDQRAMVQIRNALGSPDQRNIYLSYFATPHDMEVIIDPLGIEPPRLAVLMTRWVNLAAMVELRNAFGPQMKSSLYGRQGVRPRFMALVDDPVARIAILGVSSATGRAEAELHNVAGPPTRSVLRFRDGFTPLDFEVMDDVDGDGNPDLVMLSRQDADGRAALQAQNTDRSNFRVQLLTSAPLDPAGSMAVVDDVDGDGFGEVAVLLSRQTDARMRADIKNIAGMNVGNHAHLWLSSP